MKIVNLFFSCVAWLNFPKIGAMENDPRVIYNQHGHPHTTDYDPANGIGMIFITKVVAGGKAEWHTLIGFLDTDTKIETCNGPYGHAIVSFNPREQYYACMKPYIYHHDPSVDSDQTDISNAPVFLATVHVRGRLELEADLAPIHQRATLSDEGRLYHSDSFIRQHRLRPCGHVTYIKSVPNHPNRSFVVDGHLYRFVYPGQTS